MEVVVDLEMREGFIVLKKTGILLTCQNFGAGLNTLNMREHFMLVRLSMIFGGLT